MYAGRKQVGLRGERAKALVGVIAVHAFLGLALVTGLAMRSGENFTDALKTFDVPLEIPPPIEPPSEEPRKTAEAAAPPAPKADPMPAEAPKPVIPLPVRPAAPVAGLGGAAASGASTAGPGTGAGGAGSGTGGGGDGGGSPTPARLISGGLGRSDYRWLVGDRLPAGQATFVLKIGPGGRAENCRTGRSSGASDVDSAICDLLVRRLLFRAARNGQGQAIAQDINYVASWRPR